jgi:hypothetical protein
MIRRFLGVAALFVVGASSGFSATAPAALPDPGVDLSGYVNLLTTNLGTVLSYAIGGGFAIFALLLGVHYIKSLMGGKRA